MRHGPVYGTCLSVLILVRYTSNVSNVSNSSLRREWKGGSFEDWVLAQSSLALGASLALGP